jgi:DNA adenine methylase
MPRRPPSTLTIVDRASSPLPIVDPEHVTDAVGDAVPLDLRYPGGKGTAGLAEWICERLPTHIYYAEPFAGKGSVYRCKPPALRSWLIDTDDDIVAWWASIATVGDAPDRAAAASHATAAKSRTSCLHRRPRRWPRQSSSLAMVPGCGIRFCELAAEWQIPDLLIYCDPPYRRATRTRDIYRHEMTDADHERLLAALRMLRGPALVSAYRCPMYLTTLADWKLESRWVITRGGTLREECLFSNAACDAAPPAVAMKYSELGANYRERERINRKAQRWSKMFLAMPDRERRAILLALLDANRKRTPSRSPSPSPDPVTTER